MRARIALMAAAAAVYAVAAWTVAPGFYDGFGPPQPYNFTCPPPQAGANQKPSSGHVDIPVTNGTSEADSAFTDDGQVVIGFLPGSFDTSGKTSIRVDITPLSTCPQPKGVKFVTNVYQVTADAPLVKAATLDLRYSNLEPDPSDVFTTTDPNGTWKALGRSQNAQPYVATVSVTALGYFGAGYAVSSPPPGTVNVGGGGQTLPIIVAVLIALVVLAGIPLAIIRRRGGAVEEGEDDE